MKHDLNRLKQIMRDKAVISTQPMFDAAVEYADKCVEAETRPLLAEIAKLKRDAETNRSIIDAQQMTIDNLRCEVLQRAVDPMIKYFDDVGLEKSE